MSQSEEINQCPVENLRLFQVRQVRGIFDDFQTRGANPAPHELRISDRPDWIVAAHDDERRYANARKIFRISPQRHSTLGRGSALWIEMLLKLTNQSFSILPSSSRRSSSIFR
jgi:hypothetical protein